jgi:hypothetical protein
MGVRALRFCAVDMSDEDGAQHYCLLNETASR